jgi:hypothetical protein
LPHLQEHLSVSAVHVKIFTLVAPGLLKVKYKMRRFSRYERHGLAAVSKIKPIAYRSIAGSG